MSFYLLPSVSYQTQQRMKKNLEEKKKQLEKQQKLKELRDSRRDNQSELYSISDDQTVYDAQSTFNQNIQPQTSVPTKPKLKEKPKKSGSLFSRTKKKEVKALPSASNDDTCSIKSDSPTSINAKFFKKKTYGTPNLNPILSSPQNQYHNPNFNSSSNDAIDLDDNQSIKSVSSTNSLNSKFSKLSKISSNQNPIKKLTSNNSVSTNQLNSTLSNTQLMKPKIAKKDSLSSTNSSTAYNYNFNTDLKEILNFEKNMKKQLHQMNETPRSRQLSVASTTTTSSSPSLNNSNYNSSNSVLNNNIPPNQILKCTTSNSNKLTPTSSYSSLRKNSKNKISNINTNSMSTFLTNLPIDISNFKLVMKVSMLNNNNISKLSYVPNYQLNKYKNFLKFQENHHDYDSLAFAEIRRNSLIFFTKNFEKNSGKFFRLKFYFQNFIFSNEIQITEELLQLNFLNYLKTLQANGLDDNHLVNLPTKLQSDLEFNPNSSSSDIDQFSINSTNSTQSANINMSTNTITLNPGSGQSQGTVLNSTTSNRQPSSKDDYITSMEKILNEFSLIELYAIQVMKKFNCNSTINPSIERSLITKFNENLDDFNSIPNNSIMAFRPIKILNYNHFFSSQLSWQLAFDLPFAEIYESGSYNENKNLFVDSNLGKVHPSPSEQSPILDNWDHKQLHHFMTSLNITKQPTIAIKQKFHFQRGSSIDEKFKPLNVFNIDKSLFEIPSNHFELIQSRDLFFQVQSHQMKICLNEFHRILKKDGFLELPLVDVSKMGCKSSEFAKSVRTLTKFLQEDLKLITNSSSIIVDLLREAGFTNIKYSLISMSSESSYNDYLNKFLQFRLFDVVGFDKLNQVWSSEQENSEGDLLYTVHIIAQK